MERPGGARVRVRSTTSEGTMNLQQYPLKKCQYFSDLTAKKFVVWHGMAGRTMHTPVSGRPGKATTSIDAGTSTPIASALRGSSIATA
jgi:hypothetical protein